MATSAILAPVLNTIEVGFTALVPVSLILFTHQRALNPLYGSYPTSYSLDTVVSVAIFASVVKPFRIEKSWNWLAAALVLSIAPNASHWIAVWTARAKWVVLGPALAHAAVVAPLVFLFTNFVSQSGAPASQHRLLRAAATYFITKSLTQKVLPKVSYLNQVSESQIFLALAGAAFSAFILCLDFHTRPAKTKKKVKEPTPKTSFSPVQIKGAVFIAFTAFWYIVSPQLANPVLPHPLKETFTHPTGRLQIHSSVQSVTGLIVVGETLPPLHGEEDPMHSARYLRADHSLLGGTWMRDRAVALDDEPFVVDAFGTKLGDTVYSTFVLQEAARLVNSTEAGKTGKWNNALAIGLGTGLSATAFIRHGLNTTIVEIDPAVYDAARTWFGLPDPGPGNVFLEDARGWVERRSQKVQAGVEKNLYDIVVHDCFSGGGVPEHIFTTEFWDSLEKTMEKEGVLVVNFAGIINSESSRMVLNTLEQSFKQCRAFHDWMQPLEDDQYNTEFINMVLFCTNSKAPLTFRKPKRSDYLGSHLRKHMFQGLAMREVNLDAVRVQDPEEVKRYILTDDVNPLGKLQKSQGLHHWAVMREVLRDEHWETY
ncbi:spermidine synthase [Macrolepiota fuliginosa MF-IS2]|uniref:Spermidine synthase n=1 Tax=Macrolepiota fuliginosa MF-IS2 TaxID=1400762 RepID=A0A9P6C6F9_9AGAR|nr:spermidine synthase [Macrolepiota fuliginosa MF-IS2]